MFKGQELYQKATEGMEIREKDALKGRLIDEAAAEAESYVRQTRPDRFDKAGDEVPL